MNSTKILVQCDTDNCTDDDEDRNTPLTYAAINEHVEVMRVLLYGGANVDRANAKGTTALHVSAWSQRLDMCRLLLDWGAKVDPLNVYQLTPLHYAAWAGNLSVVKLLVDRGADVTRKTKGGRTASEYARSHGKKGVADWLDSVSRG